MRGIGGSTLRGGQTVFHSIRMWGQLFRAAMLFAAFTTVAVPAWTLWQRTTGAEWYAAGMVTLAEVKLVLGYDPDSGQEIRFEDGTRRVLRIRDIAASLPAREARERIRDEMFASAGLGAASGAGLIGLFLVAFWVRGAQLGRQKRIRGAEMVTAGELRRRVQSPNARLLVRLPGGKRLRPYSIAGIPWPERTETQHTIVSGTTGSGKTVLISDLVSQITERIKDGEKLVRACYTVAVYAPLDALDEAEQAVRAIYHGQGWRVNAERYVQLPSWLACLPMASAGGLDADLERMGRMKTLLTSSAVNLAPLHGEWRGQPANPDNPPALFLIGRRGQPACWSPFANEAGNYNVAVTGKSGSGKSGSGKSVLMQELVTGLIGAGGEAVVIDDGRSFQHTAEAMGGAFIAFGKDPACLNPFAMIDAGTAEHDGDYREECFAMLAGVIGRMARRRGSIDDIEAALIAEAIAAAWDEAGNDADLGTVRKNLEGRDDRRAKDMATALGPWCPGGAMGRLFAGSNVPDLENAMTVFELAELKGRGDVQAVVLMLVVFLSTQRMYHGPRTRAKAIVIDEAWDLLSGEDSRAFLEGAARRARKYRGALVTGTQSVNDYYANPTMPEPGNATAFGPVIFAYSRAQAIEDGILVDVTDTAREAGFNIPVALTRGVWERLIALPEGYQGFQDERGRLWDVLWMARHYALRASNSDRVRMCVLVRDIRKDLRDSNRPPRKHFPIVAIGAGDRGEAVITIMWPEDD